MSPMKPTLLGKIFSTLNAYPVYQDEAPFQLGLYGPQGGKLSNSLAGLLYCLVNDHKLEGYRLVVGNYEMGQNYDEIFMWVLDNAPMSYVAALRAKAQYDKENA